MELVKHTNSDYGMREEAKDFPMMCVLSFIYVCNARCPNCPYNNSDIRTAYKDALYMSEEIFKIIADQCAPYHSYLRLSGGGEPMLHPQAVELIEYAKAKGAKIGLITNGSVFTDEKLHRIIKAGVDMIEFSVDAGDEITYDKVRPGLNWKILVNNVQKAVEIRNELDSPTKIIVSIINQKDVDVEAAEAFWSTMVDQVQIRKYLTWGYNEENSADASPYLPPEERVPCPWLFERLNIDSRGDVTVCGEDIAFKEKYGNIKEKAIKELWHDAKIEFYRQKHLARQGNDIELCKNCPDWKYRSWNHNYWKIEKEAEKKRKLDIENYEKNSSDITA